jgi:hypothetical protein
MINTSEFTEVGFTAEQADVLVGAFRRVDATAAQRELVDHASISQQFADLTRIMQAGFVELRTLLSAQIQTVLRSELEPLAMRLGRVETRLGRVDDRLGRLEDRLNS